MSRRPDPSGGPTRFNPASCSGENPAASEELGGAEAGEAGPRVTCERGFQRRYLPAALRRSIVTGSPFPEGTRHMAKTRWPIAIPLAVFLLGTTAWGSTIRDEARMFSPRVVEEAQRHLDRLERATNVPVVIETIPHL